MKILLTGGGTGGHVMPIVAVAQELKKQAKLQNIKIELLWIGEKRSQEAASAQKYNIPFRAIFCGKFRRYFSFGNFFDAFKILIGMIQAHRILKKFKPDAIFSKGGYASAPIILASRKLNAAIYLHESDSIPGQANLYFAKYAKKIFITFSESARFFREYKNKVILSGLPIRQESLHGNKRRSYRIFGLDYRKPVILFIGGSQGAKKINDLVLEILPKLLKKYQVIHLVGGKNIREIKSKVYKSLSDSPFLQRERANTFFFVKGGLREIYHYHFYAFLDAQKLADAIVCADLVISRAGANALFELGAMAKSVILIPYPFAAAGHQITNAGIFRSKGAAKVLFEKNIDAQKLFSTIETIMQNETEKEKLSANILKMYQQFSADAAEKIAKTIFAS